MALQQKYDVGTKHNNFVVIGKVSDYNKRLVRCKCGNEEIKFVSQILNNKWGCSKCSKKMRKIACKKRFTTHNLSSNKRLVRIFYGMKERCYGKTNTKYYKNKGIKVCKEWKDNFENFAKWAFKNGYKSNLTIDRIDNNKNYCPKNCRWVTMKVQSNNRDYVKKINFNNLSMNLCEWADYLKIKRSTLAQRYYVYGWSIDKCLTTGVKNYT